MLANRILKSTLRAWICFAAVAMLAGCDKIASVYESSTKKDTSKTKTTAAPSTTSSTTPSTTENSQKQEPLPANVIARVGSWSLTIEDFNEKLTKLKSILPDFDPADAKSKKVILE